MSSMSMVARKVGSMSRVQHNAEIHTGKLHYNHRGEPGHTNTRDEQSSTQSQGTQTARIPRPIRPAPQIPGTHNLTTDPFTDARG